MYKVIRRFTDAETQKTYTPGEEYNSSKVKKPRLEMLSSEKNALGYPVIILVEDVKTPDVPAESDTSAEGTAEGDAGTNTDTEKSAE